MDATAGYIFDIEYFDTYDILKFGNSTRMLKGNLERETFHSGGKL